MGNLIRMPRGGRRDWKKCAGSLKAPLHITHHPSIQSYSGKGICAECRREVKLTGKDGVWKTVRHSSRGQRELT